MKRSAYLKHRNIEIRIYAYMEEEIMKVDKKREKGKEGRHKRDVIKKIDNWGRAIDNGGAILKGVLLLCFYDKVLWPKEIIEEEFILAYDSSRQGFMEARRRRPDSRYRKLKITS